MDNDNLEFTSIVMNDEIGSKTAQEPTSVSLLEEHFSAYTQAYTQSPFKPFSLLSASQRRTEMRRRLPEFGPNREVTFSGTDDCPGIYYKRFSADGKVS
jgi:hypothetical protein